MSPLSVTLLALTHAQLVLMFAVSLLPFVYVVVSAFDPGMKSRVNPALRKLAGNGERGTPTPLLTVKMLFDPEDAPQSGGVDTGTSSTLPSSSNPVFTSPRAGAAPSTTSAVETVTTAATSPVLRSQRPRIQP